MSAFDKIWSLVMEGRLGHIELVCEFWEQKAQGTLLPWLLFFTGCVLSFLLVPVNSWDLGGFFF